MESVMDFIFFALNLVFPSLNRTVELGSKVLTFGKTQINLVILSLNRTFAPSKP